MPNLLFFSCLALLWTSTILIRMDITEPSIQLQYPRCYSIPRPHIEERNLESNLFAFCREEIELNSAILGLHGSRVFAKIAHFLWFSWSDAKPCFSWSRSVHQEVNDQRRNSNVQIVTVFTSVIYLMHLKMGEKWGLFCFKGYAFAFVCLCCIPRRSANSLLCNLRSVNSIFMVACHLYPSDCQLVRNAIFIGIAFSI